MLLWLILLFVTMPLIELALLIRVAQAIDLGPTLLLVVVTGVIGATLAKRQGIRTWMNVQRELAEGRMPTSEIVDALLIFVAGVVLITPGIVTDAIGFALLIPPARALFKAAAAKYFKSRIVVMHHPPSRGDEFIDAEVTDVRDVEPRGELQ